MLFLIDYDRTKGRIVALKPFLKSESNTANADRLEIELNHLRQEIEREVVILEAESESALRRTHRRYFETFLELVESF